MNFAFSEEQEELRKTVRSFLESKSPESEVRRLMDTEDGYDPAVWSQMGEQMGLQGLAIPEEFGGSGYSFVELGVVLEEMGRALLCVAHFVHPEPRPRLMWTPRARPDVSMWPTGWSLQTVTSCRASMPSG